MPTPWAGVTDDAIKVGYRMDGEAFLTLPAIPRR
jgi:hypothetical protein